MKFQTVRLFFLCCILTVSTCYTVSAALLDPGFGNDGRVAVELGVYGDRANAVAVQPDGRIVVAGSSSNASNLDFFLFRLLDDGSLDSDFNYDGTVTTAVGSGDDEVLAISLQDDGKIIAAGYSSNGTDRDFALARYNSDGSLDRNFGLEGLVVTSVGNSDDEITGIVLQADGSILVTGSALGTAGRVIVLGRYFSDGTLDPDFGDDGFSFTGVGEDVQAESIALLDDQQILVAGTYSEGDKTGMMIVGFTPDGQLDTGFGDNGIAVAADGEMQSEGYGLALRSNGKILVAGAVGQEGKRDAALFQFLATGAPDTDFEDNGVLVTAVSAEDDVLYDVVVTGDLVAASGSTMVGSSPNFLFITYEKSGVTVQKASLTTETNRQNNSSSWLQISDLQVEDSFSEYNNDTTADNVVVDVLTTEFSDGADIATALDVVSAASIVAVGVSRHGEATSAAVTRYQMANIMGDPADLSKGSEYVLTGEPYNVTRVSAVIPVKILSDIGNVTQRGIVFNINPNPVLTDGSDGGAPNITNDTDSHFSSGATVTLKISTDVDATCKYSTVDLGYTSMADDFSLTGGTSHSAEIGSLADGSYTYYTRCEGTTGDVNTTSTSISFSVGNNAEAVTITNTTPGSFDDGAAVVLSITTDRDATCKYNEDSDVAYASMAGTFSGAGSTSHTSDLGNALASGTYTYFARCKDSEGNENSSGTTISFEVKPATAGILNKTLQRAGDFIVPSALAADNSTSTNFFNPKAEHYVTRGHTKDGAGVGAFSAQLEKLQPGTFFYARAYAIVGDKTYYGNNVGFRTSDSCFVATAAFGSILHPSVRILRTFRDNYLLTSGIGRSLVRQYYRYSPPLADIIAVDGTLRQGARILLLPLVGIAWLSLQLGVLKGLFLLTAVAIFFCWTLRARRGAAGTA